MAVDLPLMQIAVIVVMLAIIMLFAGVIGDDENQDFIDYLNIWLQSNFLYFMGGPQHPLSN
jgi:hypothetical protein